MTRRRRLALVIESWLYKLAFWLDVHTAPKYDPATWSRMDITEDEWDSFYKSFTDVECE